NGMEFPTEAEEDPAEFARELANQIWKSSEEPAPTKSAHQVTIQPRQPEHDHVFAEYDAFAQWRKAPVQANTPRDLNRSEPDPDRVVSDKSVVPEENEHFPLIRPQAEVRNTSVLNEGSTGDVPQIIPSRTSKAATQESTSHASLQSPPILEDQARQASRTEPSSPPQWASADTGVQFAIAHEKSVVSDVVIPNESSGSSLPEWAAQPAAFPVDVSGLIEPRRLESESAKETKPVLMAPSFEPQAIEPDPEPIAPVAFQVPSEGSPTWQELTSELAPQFEEAPADVPQLTPGSELKWGVIGFISAVLTTLIGVSLSRRQNSPPREPGNPESAAPSESTQSDEEDNFLQMKRVA
ncbi:MAG: hypothetical protein KDA80_07920, partial [Planctomycetaceae bacterium]|nr:hypothetical protein [Planctomycetaceae bacterium]